MNHEADEVKLSVMASLCTVALLSTSKPGKYLTNGAHSFHFVL